MRGLLLHGTHSRPQALNPQAAGPTLLLPPDSYPRLSRDLAPSLSNILSVLSFPQILAVPSQGVHSGAGLIPQEHWPCGSAPPGMSPPGP